MCCFQPPRFVLLHYGSPRTRTQPPGTPRMNHVCTLAYLQCHATATTSHLQNFIFPNRNSVPVKQTSSPSLLRLPVTPNISELLSVPGFTYSENLISTGSYRICLSVSGFFYPASRSQGPSTLRHGSVVHATAWPDHISFLPSSVVEGHGHCFHFLAGRKGTLLL